MLEFPTSIGKLNIVLYQEADQVQVRVANKEMWAELKKRGEEIGKNCLFGGVKLKEVVERGNFTRCGIWSEKQKEVSEKLFSWADKVREKGTLIHQFKGSRVWLLYLEPLSYSIKYYMYGSFCGKKSRL